MGNKTPQTPRTYFYNWTEVLLPFSPFPASKVDQTQVHTCVCACARVFGIILRDTLLCFHVPLVRINVRHSPLHYIVKDMVLGIFILMGC